MKSYISEITTVTGVTYGIYQDGDYYRGELIHSPNGRCMSTGQGYKTIDEIERYFIDNTLAGQIGKNYPVELSRKDYEAACLKEGVTMYSEEDVTFYGSLVSGSFSAPHHTVAVMVERELAKARHRRIIVERTG